jgi:hypothetical protein
MDKLQHMCEQFRSDKLLELEVCIKPKIGYVQKTYFKQVLGLMLRSTEDGMCVCKQKSDEPERLVDAFYEDDVRVRYQIGAPECITKKLVSKIVGVCPQREFQLSFNLKRETPTEFDWRAQRCWTFVYKGLFAYTLKIVQSAKEKENVTACKETFEIEIELLHEESELEDRTNEELVNSFLEKALDMCGRYELNSSVIEKLTVEFPDDDKKKRSLEKPASKPTKKAKA